MRHHASRSCTARLATLAITAAAMLVSPAALAESTPFPAAIRKLEEGGFEVFERREAPGGLTAYVGRLSQRAFTVFATADGDHAVSGSLYDKDGKKIAPESLPRLPGPLPTDGYWARAEASRWIADGAADAPRIIYLFTDPNCTYCDQFWRASRPWVDAGKVQIRHILVAVTGRGAENKAAAILSAASPVEALTTHGKTWMKGGIRGLAPIPDIARQALEDNQAAMQALAFRGTPGIVYLDREDKVRRFVGMPYSSNLTEVMGPR